MSKTKKVLSIILISIFIVTQFSTICLGAAVPVTDENLNEALQKFVSSEENEGNYSISASNNIINITDDEQTHTLNYDLTDNPTFLFETVIEKGISYEEFEKETDNLIFPMIGYVAVANIQGVEVEDATTYFALSYLESALKQDTSNENKYTIVDDLNVSDGVTTEKTDDPNTIYTSEFGDRVIEYLDNMYKNNIEISDSDDINSYVYTIEKQDITDTSRKLVAKAVVNLDADFSQINGYMDKIEDSFNSGITKENADTVITLKVGQKCIIKSEDKLTGYAFYGDECVEMNKDYTEMTATKVGVRTGYLQIGDVKKSIYITVEENLQNLTYEPATITIKKKVTTTEKEETNNKPVNNNNNNNAPQPDNSQANKEIPKTGSNFVMKRACLSIACIATMMLVFVLLYNKKLGMKNGKNR